MEYRLRHENLRPNFDSPKKPVAGDNPIKSSNRNPTATKFLDEDFESKPGNSKVKPGSFKAIPDDVESEPSESNSAATLMTNAKSVSSKKQIEKTITDDSEAIPLEDQRDADACFRRAQVWLGKREFAKALSNFDDAIRLDPKFVSAYRRCAWVRATCSDSEIRDGQQAVLDATKACELTDWKNDDSLMVLAAALAEAGRMDEALQRLQQSIEMLRLNNAKTKAKMLARFQEGQPYHAEPQPK